MSTNTLIKEAMRYQFTPQDSGEVLLEKHVLVSVAGESGGKRWVLLESGSLSLLEGRNCWKALRFHEYKRPTEIHALALRCLFDRKTVGSTDKGQKQLCVARDVESGLCFKLEHA